ncbi:MAG: tRNA pseudouridine(38-40) synthase TruA [Candidatus Krumholzibacteriota bacterium]|nr:tRNA pseudouridine(38-40) synthase TruA [Candidatus Krumholzibacteriota bacterium]
MRNLKLTIEYNGRDFSGWQIQNDRTTVQGELYRAFSELADGAIKIIGGGRTDAGVHAVGQVANVRIETSHDVELIKRAINAKLPRSILIKDIEEADPAFNARYDARSRSYRYIFITRPTAIWNDCYYYTGDQPDIELMKRAVKRLVGYHDFASFATSGDSRSTWCRIMRAELIENEPLLTLHLKADRFLYNMVRTIAGTIMEIGRGKDLDIVKILEARDRRVAGPTLPPYALYFMEIEYRET